MYELFQCLVQQNAFSRLIPMSFLDRFFSTRISKYFDKAKILLQPYFYWEKSTVLAPSTFTPEGSKNYSRTHYIYVDQKCFLFLLLLTIIYI